MNKRIMILSGLLLWGALLGQAQPSYSVTDSLDFDKAAASSPLHFLKGRVSGVRVSSIDGGLNGSYNVNIRGMNALRTDAQPLYVVDGTVLNSSLKENLKAFWQFGETSYTSPMNQLSFISPYDIESVEVIKDLSATAIYGSKGANGVVIIKTRLPKTGEKSVIWNSDFIYESPVQKIDQIGTGFGHRHNIAASGEKNNTRYSIRGSFRTADGSIPGEGNTFGSLVSNFETRANSVVWFGLNTLLSAGKMDSSTGSSWFGKPSLTLGLREPNLFAHDGVSAWLEDYNDEAVDYRTVNSMYLTLNLPKGIRLKTTFGMDFENNDRYIWYGNKTTFGEESNGAAAVLNSMMFTYDAASTLSFTRFFGKNYLSLYASGEAYGSWSKFNTMSGLDYFSHALRARGLSLLGSRPKVHRFDHEFIQPGVSAGLTYKWSDKLTFDALCRADCTPKYDDGEMTYFPAASFSYIISPCISVNAGYGKAGKSQFVPYELMSDYVTGSYVEVESGAETFFNGLNILSSEEWHAGLDLSLPSGRASLSVTYYDKATDDKISIYSFGTKTKELWDYSARELLTEQISTLGNKGFEFDLLFKAIDTDKVKLTFDANFAYNVNQMIAFDRNDQLGRKVGSDLYTNVNVLGYPLSAFFGYKTDAEGNFIEQNGNTTIDFYDKVIIGNPVPKYYGGLNTTLSVGGLTFDALLSGVGGFDILNLNRCIADGEPYNVSEKYVEKGDYLRLDRLSVSYRMRLPFLKSAESLKVRLSGCNLLTLTDYSGWNPDVNSFSVSNLSNGIDYGSYPAIRSLVAGLTLTF